MSMRLFGGLLAAGALAAYVLKRALGQWRQGPLMADSQPGAWPMVTPRPAPSERRNRNTRSTPDDLLREQMQDEPNTCDPASGSAPPECRR